MSKRNQLERFNRLCNIHAKVRLLLLDAMPLLGIYGDMERLACRKDWARRTWDLLDRKTNEAYQASTKARL